MPKLQSGSPYKLLLERPGAVEAPVASSVTGLQSGSPYSRFNQLTPFGADSPMSESTENIQRYNNQLLEAGIDPPKTGRVLGTVSAVLEILRTGEYAVGGLLAGKGPIAGVRGKISPSDVLGFTPNESQSFMDLLKQPKFYGALAIDILLDPTTYLTFGFGGGAKLATRVGTKILNRSGKDLLKRAVAQFGEDSARKMMATSILREGGEKYLASGGLKFMGREFLPRSVVQAPFKGIDWAIERTPIVGWGYKGTKDLLSKAFKPFANIDSLPVQLGGSGKFEEMTLATMKGIRAEDERQLRLIGGWMAEAKKAGVVNPGKIVANLIEFDKQTGNKVIDDIAGWMAARHKEMGFAEIKRGILAEEVPVDLPGYMRHFLTDEGRVFLRDRGKVVRDEFLGNIKQFRVKAPFAKGRKLTGTVSEINNLYKEKYGIKIFEEDAFKAFSQRTVEHIRATKMYDFFDNLVKESIAKQAPIVPTLKRTKAGLKKINQISKTTMIDGVKMIETKIPQLDGFLVPEPIAKHLDMAFSFMQKDEVSKSFLNLFDATQRIWKGSVTGWFLAFHMRNGIGGVFNNWLAGLNNPKWYIETEKLLRGKNLNQTFTTDLGEKITGKQILREVEDLGVTGAPGMVDVMKSTEEIMRLGYIAQSGGYAKAIGKGVATGEIKESGKMLMQYPRVAMEAVEDRLRIPLYLQRRMLGDSKEQAAKHVFKFHFDYAPEAFTPFERNVMRRIIPFYTWTRGNVPLQIEQMMKQPGKFAGLEKLRGEINAASGQEAVDEEQYLPQWMKEMFLFRLPGESKEGLLRYLQVDLPLEDINKLPFTESGRREIISLLSPFIKYPVERIANRNLYFGSEIYNANLPREYQTAKTMEALKFLPQPIKDYLNFKEITKKDPVSGKPVTAYEMDAIKLHAIRSVLAGRFYSTVASATDSELDAWMRLSRVLGGVPVRPVDMEEEKLKRVKEQEYLTRDVLQYMKRRGLLDKSGNIYKNLPANSPYRR